MHPRLLWDVIRRQAGSVSKAIIEGVMNSVDAGATSGAITLNARGFTIIDDGKGMTLEEIRRNFKVFGQPHEAGDAAYGRYRMGRGQMFSFGRNVWRTGTNVITIDLKPQMSDADNKSYKLGFEISQGRDDVKGCRISVEFYDDLDPRSLAYMLDDVAKQVKYVSIPITLNGKRVSQSPDTLKWNEETDFAYFKSTSGSGLDVYNLGIFVCTIPTYDIGVSGVFVSKQAIEVNFARNQVVQNCKVWRAAQKIFAAYREKKKEARAALTDGDRENICRRIANGTEDVTTVMSMSILQDVTGSNISLVNLSNRLDKTNGIIGFAPSGDKSGETADQRRVATVLSTNTLARFGVETWEELKGILRKGFPDKYNYTVHWSARRTLENILGAVELSEQELTGMFESTYTPVGDSELTFSHLTMVKALREINSLVAQAIPAKPRTILAGQSTTADGWTDGLTRIYINVGELDKARKGIGEASKLVGLMLHEYLHNTADNNSHLHDIDFYRSFHDIALDRGVIGKVTEQLIREIGKLLTAANSSGPFKNRAFRVFNEVSKATGIANFVDDFEPAPNKECLSCAAKA